MTTVTQVRELATRLGLPVPQPVGLGLFAVAATVTPEMATAWLANHNRKNRKLKVSATLRYGRDMASGRWLLNGESIIFDCKGRLMDGQNRLVACVNAGVAVPFLVVMGVGGDEDSDGVMSTIDGGIPRTGADALGLQGVTNSQTASSLIMHIVRWEQGLPFQAPISPAEQVAALGRHDLTKAIAVTRRSKVTFRHFNHVVLGALYYLFARASEDAADNFVNRLIDGFEMKKGDPVLTLRNVIVKNASSPSKFPALTMYVYIVKAWNFAWRGEECHVLKWLPSEGIPRICGLAPPGFEEGRR